MKNSYPCKAYIVERYGALERVLVARSALCIVGVPVHTDGFVHAVVGQAEEVDGAVANACVVDVGRYFGARGHARTLRVSTNEAVRVVGLVVGVLKRLVDQIAHECAIEVEEAAIAEYALPQLHAHNAEYEEYEEAEEEHVAEHRQGVKQEHHQYTHAFFFYF